MIRSEKRDTAAPLRVRIARATLLAATLFAVSPRASADGFHLFPETQHATPSTELHGDADPAISIADLEDSYPWTTAGFAELSTPETGESDQPSPSTPAPPAPPKKFWTTGTTLWTAAALVGGFGQGIGAPLKYGTQSWHFTNEGWFGYDTYAGGADKASHFIISSGVSRLLYDSYLIEGHTVNQSFNLALATTLMAGIFVETGDAITVYGWSWQDLTADFLGAASGLLIHRCQLQDMLGLRVGPADTDVPAHAAGTSEPGIGASYTDEIYTVDLKLGGLIKRLHGKPGISRFFLTSFVYFTKGFGYGPPLPSRYQEMGVELGIDFPAILKEVGVPETKWWGRGLYAFFNFFRIPYTQVGAYYNFKSRKWYGPSAPNHYQ